MINNEDVVKKDIEIFQRQKRRHVCLFFNPLHFLVEVLYFLCLKNVFLKYFIAQSIFSTSVWNCEGYMTKYCIVM